VFLLVSEAVFTIAGLLEGEELDVEVLRIGVCTEGWQCLTDNDACDMSDAFEVLCRFQRRRTNRTYHL
jgi:hypothetical protein